MRSNYLLQLKTYMVCTQIYSARLLISHPLPDLVHVLGQDVVHVLQVRSQELLLRFSRVFLFLTITQKNDRHSAKTTYLLEPFDLNETMRGTRWRFFILERDDGRSSTDVSRHRVQDLHGILQFQLLIQRHNTGLGSVVSDQDPPQDSIVELHKPEIEREGIVSIHLCDAAISCHSTIRLVLLYIMTNLKNQKLKPTLCS